MPFDALEVSVQLITALREPAARIAQHDAGLAKQLKDAAGSISLNLGEGRRRAGRDRLHQWRIAAGSADEVATCLRVAEAWGYLAPELAAQPLQLLDRILAMTWRLTH